MKAEALPVTRVCCVRTEENGRAGLASTSERRCPRGGPHGGKPVTASGGLKGRGLGS